MKKNYNIKLDPENLTSDQIKQHMDFDAVLSEFESSPEVQPHQPKVNPVFYYLGGAVAAALIGVLIYFNGAGNNGAIETISTQQYLASQPYVNPPIKGIEQAFETKQFDANQGGIYEYDNGSKVMVPAAAFLDQDGNLVSGDVDIKFREYHDFIDFFVSGIPMEYDSSGTRYNLESAGMIEIYAEQNGQRLNLAPDKEINIQLVSEIMVPANDRANIPKFNVYKLDEEKRNWVYEGRDGITVLEEDITGLLLNAHDAISEDTEYDREIAKIEATESNELAKIEASVPRPPKPIKPEKENGNDFVFNLDFAEEDIELRGGNVTQAARELDRTQDQINELRKLYANTLWQVAPNDNDFDEEMVSQIEWEDAKIKQLNNRDYQLTLINPNKTINVTVNPVLSGADYTNALNDFNQQMASYERELAQRETQLAAQKKALADRIRDERALAKKSYEEKVAYFEAQGNASAVTDLMITNKVMNSFSVSSMGIWNCDRPLPPFIYNIEGEFVENKTKKQFKHNTAYLVDKNKNTIHRFYASEKANVLFDSKSENMLWMITDENKIAMYTPQQFKEINEQTKAHTFVMDMSDQPITSEDDLRELLVF